MRRSAAPSSQSAAKRLRFLSPFLNSSIEIEEDDIFNIPKLKCYDAVSISVPKRLEDAPSTTCKDSASNSARSSEEILNYIFEPIAETHKNTDSEVITCKDGASSSVRSTDEILKFIFEPTAESEIITDKDDVNLPIAVPKRGNKFKPSTVPESTVKRKLMVKDNNCETKINTVVREADPADSDPNIHYYNVLWCKRSAKKHKVWEGDGVLIINNRSAVLKNASGKVIDRGIGYKLKEIEAIEDGSKFFIGGKECQIQFQMSPEEYRNSDNSEPPEPDVLVRQNISKNVNTCM